VDLDSTPHYANLKKNLNFKVLRYQRAEEKAKGSELKNGTDLYVEINTKQVATLISN
jgi:hypothetical protein